jgi:Omp85 superfamily domain
VLPVTYRRTSLINARRRAPSLPAEPKTFDRVLAINGLVSSVVVGAATIALTIIGFNLTRDFNAWQQRNAAAQDSAQLKRDLAVNASVLKDRCIRIADVGTKMAMGHKSPDALRILRTVELLEPNCPLVGINLTQLSAAFVINRADGFDRAILERAARIVFADRALRAETGSVQHQATSREIIDDALGGRAYYLGRSELELPTGSATSEDGLRPSEFVDGATVTHLPPNGAKPKVELGEGVTWNSPFGPFRIDIARTLAPSPRDETKLVTFNTGTKF